MNIINEVFGEILGNYKLSFYITHFIFVLFGVLISVRLHAFNRNKNSDNTPYKFSFKFLFQDNLIRIITSMAVVFVAIRLGSDLIGINPTYPLSVIMGISFDQILIQIQKIELKARE